MADIVTRARQLREVVEELVEILPDEDAQNNAELFARWKPGVAYGEDEVGKRVSRKGKLYRIIAPHTTNPDWPPELTPELYEEIHVTPEAGTKGNPIELNETIALESQKYYVENGVTYLCIQDKDAPVLNPLSELIGLYVEKVE